MTETARKKLTSPEQLLSQRDNWRKNGKTVVWTNGCFDLLHSGHIESLEKARALGDILLVGINSDRSVKKLKGGDRPICPEDDRARVIAALAAVDYVVIFDSLRCDRELALIKPDIWAKAGDYSPESLDLSERQAVESYGGKIVFTSFVEGLSTSLILKKIRRSDPEKIMSAALAAIRDKNNRLLMVATRYLDGLRWGFPGGGQNREETLKEAVIREVFEETGLKVRVKKYLSTIERLEPKWGVHLLIHLFEAEPENSADLETEYFPANQQEDIAEVAWFDRKRLKNEPLWILGRELWLDYLADPANFPAYKFMGSGEE